MHTKKKVLIIVSMVVLLAVTTYVNIMLNKNIDKPVDKPAGDETVSQFVMFRINRETTRNATMTYLDGILASETASAEAKKNAETMKLDLIASMETETQVEGLLKAQGFEDAVIKLGDVKINVVVEKDSLQASEVAQIVSIVTSSSRYSANNVIIKASNYV